MTILNKVIDWTKIKTKAIKQSKILTNSQLSEVNRVIKNTYLLLSVTLIFSAICAVIAMKLNFPHIHWAIFLGASFGLTWMIQKNQNNASGLKWLFAFTGFYGVVLGPMLGYYLSIESGSKLVMQALSATAIIFLVLSAHVLTTKRDYSFMRGFVIAGGSVLLLAFIANRFLEIEALELAISAGSVLWAAATIIWETSRIVNNGERNYIIATMVLFGAIYTLFIRLLHLLSFFQNRD